jgi:hypothetical protein
MKPQNKNRPFTRDQTTPIAIITPDRDPEVMTN